MELFYACYDQAMAGDEETRAGALRELGEQGRRRGDRDAALECYEEAVALLRNSSDRLKFAHTIRHLGDLHREQSRWAEAEQCYMEALAEYRRHRLPGQLDLANAIRPYALLKTLTGRHDEARPLWLQAAALYAAEGIDAGVEECCRQAGCDRA